jgi:hypothetical protein
MATQADRGQVPRRAGSEEELSCGVMAEIGSRDAHSLRGFGCPIKVENNLHSSTLLR